MKISFYLIFIFLLTCGGPGYSQSIITFDNQGWSSDQSISENFTIDNFTFSGNKNLFTNYGYNFDVNNVSIYFAFQNPVSDNITITTLNNELVNLLSLGAYQVSEEEVDTLIIEGWDGPNKKYSTEFSNNNTWRILTLDYNGINKLVIKSGNLGNGSLFDYNFDNIIFSSITDTKEIDKVPQSYKLDQNYPNPFNPSTIISWQSPIVGWQTLKVYDILGNEVATLVNEEKEPGSYSVTFDASNLASGLYIYRLMMDGFVSTKKMMLLK